MHNLHSIPSQVFLLIMTDPSLKSPLCLEIQEDSFSLLFSSFYFRKYLEDVYASIVA